MKGIYGKEQALMAYLVIVCLATMADMLGDIFLKSAPHEGKNNIKENKEHMLRQIIKVIFGMAIMLATLAIMLKYCFFVFAFMAILMFLIVTPCVIGDFIRYLFGKTYGYKMTTKTERAMLLCGLFTWFVCAFIASEETSKEILQVSHNIIFLKDLLIVILLNMWYFSVVFFSVTCFLILIHKIYILWKHKKNKRDNRVKKIKKNSIKISTDYKWLIRIENVIDRLPKYKKIRKIGLYILWFFVLLVESLKVFVAVIISYCGDLVTVVVCFIKNMCCKFAEGLKRSIVTNYGQNILIVSRIAFILAISIVYLLDQYQNILSESGSSVYEFVCSVIIIPFLITQLSELSKIWNKKDEIQDA